MRTIALLVVTGLTSWAMTAAAEPIAFDVTQPTAAGPPYPASTLQIDVQSGGPPDDNIPIEILEITLENVCVPPDPCTPTTIEAVATDSGGDVGLYGADVNIGWSTHPDDSLPASGAGFELRFEMQPHPAGSAAPVMGILPCVMPTATGFDLHFVVALADEAVVEHHATFAANPAQPISLSNVVVSDPLSAAFTLTFDAVPSGPTDPGEPLFTMMMSGTFDDSAPIPVLGPLAGAVIATGLAGLGLARLHTRRGRARS